MAVAVPRCLAADARHVGRAARRPVAAGASVLAAARLAVIGFAAEHPGRLWRAFALRRRLSRCSRCSRCSSRCAGWLGLRRAGRSPTLAQAVVFESLNRVIIVAFKFVPFRIGVDEALTGALAPILSLNPAAGVSLAVVRKVRSLFWAAVGLVVIAAHPTRDAALRCDRGREVGARS